MQMHDKSSSTNRVKDIKDNLLIAFNVFFLFQAYSFPHYSTRQIKQIVKAKAVYSKALEIVKKDFLCLCTSIDISNKQMK